MNKRYLQKVIPIILALAIWQIVAMRIGMEMLLASPVNVLTRLLSIWKEPGFWQTIFYSSLRITKGFLAALVLGIVLGIAAGQIKLIELFLWPYIITIKTVPVASFIILCLIWLNFNQLTILISFLIAFPVIYSNVLQGIKSTDPKMLELAKLYKVPKGRQLLYIFVPAIKPFLLSAGGVSIGMAWKAGVAAEVIGMVGGSIGEMLYMAKIYFLNADLMCWTIIIILLSVISEKLFTFILKCIFKGVEKL